MMKNYKSYLASPNRALTEEDVHQYTFQYAAYTVHLQPAHP